MSTVYLYKKNTVDGLTVHQSQRNRGRPDNRRTRRPRLKIRSRPGHASHASGASAAAPVVGGYGRQQVGRAAGARLEPGAPRVENGTGKSRFDRLRLRFKPTVNCFCEKIGK